MTTDATDRTDPEGMGRTSTFRPLRGLPACWVILGAVWIGLCSGLLAGPIWSYDPPIPPWTDIEGRPQFRAMGPIVESVSDSASNRFWAIRPFVSRRVNPSESVGGQEFLWPVGSTRDLRGESHWRVLTALGTDFDPTNPEGRYRTWIFPFFYWGRSAESNGYAAFFPIGGEIREFLGRDKIDFALFPIWGHSTIGEAETTSLFWPIYSRTTGDGMDRFRIFPIYGRSTREDEWEKRFILWPFWTDVHYYRPGTRGGGFVLIPIYGHIKTENQESWFVIPPFIRHSRSSSLVQGYCPWPFIQYSSGDVDKFYFWPVAGYRSYDKGETSGFVLWPIGGWRNHPLKNEEDSRWWVLPLLYYNAVTPREPPSAPARQRRFTLWPLATYARDGHDKDFRTLDLWPFHIAPVERNWSPIWTIYSHKLKGDAVEDELLWGLFRHDRARGRYRHVSVFPLVSWTQSPQNQQFKEWSILRGLIARREVDGKVSYRFLYTFDTGDDK